MWSLFGSAPLVIFGVLSQFFHKLLKSYPQSKQKTTCILFFSVNQQKKPKLLFLLNFIFVELEINMWITIGRQREVAD